MQKHDLLALSIAASLAAPLLKPSGQRSFVLHLWGGTGGGKSSSLTAAMSIWGQPDRLKGSFNATNVGLENRLGLMNGLPLGINELQLANKWLRNVVYQISDEVGRTRGAMAGGLRKTLRWQTVAITNGEEPIVADNAAGGETTRTLEFEGRPIDDEKAASDLYNVLDKNFGHVGQEFIVRLISELEKNPALIRDMHASWIEMIDRDDRIKSHINSMALCAVSHSLAQTWLFGIDRTEALMNTTRLMKTLIALLPSPAEGGETDREMRFICDLIWANKHRFRAADRVLESVESWGLIEDGCCYFIPTILKRELQYKGRFRYKAAMSRLARADHILKEAKGDGTTRNVCRVKSGRFHVIVLPHDMWDAFRQPTINSDEKPE